MTDDAKQQFYIYYETGKDDLERGQYRSSVENLRKALEIYPISTKLGAEAAISLVTAYQGVGDNSSAIAICRQLATHPNPYLKEKGQYLLYILEAPRLQRPAEWMTSIPTLTTDTEKKPQYVKAKTKNRQSSQSQYQIESVDLSQVNTKDNNFIWVALGAIILALGAAFWLS